LNTVKGNDSSLNCPLPLSHFQQILMAHGGGGRLMHQLISDLIAPAFGMTENAQQDAAILSIKGQRLALTTDSYVVNPIFFPGGDIGCLSVYGTVNDLAMMGATPLYLSVGFILEEGLDISILSRVVQSMQQAAKATGVQIVTGDTKVVDRGKGDGIFINTTGVGLLETEQVIAPQSIQVGDAILLNGDLGRHGIAIMSTREGLSFESEIQSDAAPLAGLVQALIKGGITIHAMRDLTRGGLASALNEIAQAANIQITINESTIPVSEDVRGACELLGLDPLYVANEGRFIAFVPAAQVEPALAIAKSFPALGKQSVCIGRVDNRLKSSVILQNTFGNARILSLLSGEQMPRIC